MDEAATDVVTFTQPVSLSAPSTMARSVTVPAKPPSPVEYPTFTVACCFAASVTFAGVVHPEATPPHAVLKVNVPLVFPVFLTVKAADVELPNGTVTLVPFGVTDARTVGMKR